ncbi:MAG: amino acid adenylation domain-containing protein [Bacteroidales bacterium]|nr:amino acid adenylation domain-containing protein [Candidatus Physcousia equi]
MIFPLSQSQLGIYVTCMSAQEEGNYNIDMLYTLDNDVDLDRLSTALDKVVEAHPYVKSRLVTDAQGDVVFEDHTDEEFHTSIFEINDIEEARPHFGSDYDLMLDQLFRLEIYKTLKGNYLYVDFHHIIFDGFSFKVFLDDLAKAYDGVALEAEKMSGSDIVQAEVEERKSAKYEEAKAWYAQEFGAACEIDSMPLADVYGNDETHYGRKYVKLNLDAAAKEAVCKKAGVRESVLFTAAFGMTLSKYAGENEVAYNTVYHGRQNEDTHRSFTMMVKTLPVYHNFEQTSTVAELLQQTKAQNRGARQNTAYSYADLATDLGVKSDINFAYQGAFHTFDVTLGGKKQQAEDLITNTPGIKFLFMVMITDGAYYAWVEYQKNKYSDAFIDTFIATYEHILGEMCQKETLAEVTVCNDEMLKQLDTFNAQEQQVLADNDADETILSLFQKAANQYPNNIAAVFKEKSYTYKQLDELTDKIAALIYDKTKDCGKQEPVVSILIPRNEYMFLLPLSAQKAGCAYQPLDPSYPQERLNFMVKDADAALLIADDNLKEVINEYEGEVLLTNELTEEKLNTLPSPPCSTLTPSSLFILLYTSGSTGVPKGVMLEHRQVLAYIRWYQQQYEITSASVIAAYASFGFDANMMDMYPALTSGATLCIIPEEIRLDLMALRDFMNEHGVTISFMTTQVAQQFALNVDDCKTLKHLSMGGEKMMSMNPREDFKLHNIYGPTECSVAVTHYEVNKYEQNIPIGKPTTTTNLRIVDKALHRLPVGAAGELIVSGQQVGRGYLNRPEKTSEVFIEHEGARWYRTGDIVRYREDGNIEFVGRKDGQVKIRGFRIELKEVEAVIRDFEGIEDVTVQAFDNPGGGKFLAAYIVSAEPVDVDALNNFILDQKPPYMVPTVTMQIEQIPLNVNQKVDKKALPKPEVKAKAASEAPAAPLNALEAELKTIIASVVNTEEFGITDVLGFVGLTSISSIKLATLIYKKFGVQVDSKSLAKTGSLQSIENEILNLWMRVDGNKSSQPISQTENCPDTQDGQGAGQDEALSAPLTYPQMGVYLDCLKNPGSTLYNVPSKVVFPSSISCDELQSAVNATIANHQSFRFTFGHVNGETCQLLQADMPIEVPIKEMSTEAAETFEQEFMRPFNLEKGPLFRFEIVQTPQQLILYLDIHHLITDGGSVDLIIREIAARLNHENAEKEEYTYMQFALDQKAAEGGAEYKAAKEFFHSRLATCEGASEITADMPKNDDALHTLGTTCSPVNLQPVEAMAKRLGVTPMSVFLAAAYYTVCRFVNNKQVYLGTISNGRSNLRTYNTTGMFVNTLALSSEIKEQTVSEYVKETAENFTETIQHEQYPFAQIAADYDFKPEIIFEYQVGVMAGCDVRGELVSPKVLNLDLAKFKIKIAVNDTPDGGHEIAIGYDEAVYSPTLAHTLADSVCAVVEHFVEQPDALLKTISIMSKEQEQEVEKLRCVSMAPVENRLFYEPIEKYALSQPDKVALIAADRTLTYSQFNAEANRVAHALMARGVRKGDRVVVLLPRTSAVMLTIFGVSKAGAAYIPCDPEYPADRINLITEDSEARFVITTKEKMENYPGKAIDIEDIIRYEADNCFSNPHVDVTPDDLVYLIYTSGSTGRPKGVMLRHEGICNYLQSHPGNRHIHAMACEGSCYLSVTTLSFDMSLKEYGVALFNGLTLVLTDENQSNNPIELARLFKETGADIFNATPSRLLNYMELPEFCDALRQCKCVLSGGEAYSDKLLARLHELKPQHIFNTYGPTEITVSSNCAELTHTNQITIGQPLLNYIEFVVDVDGNELPVGVVGELYIGGGVGVAKGYNNLEKQTHERFVDYKGVRCYRSGDYARWTPDGRIVTLGRMDNQIKLRGLRIELGEVEAAICKVEGVKQTVVMVRKVDNVEHLTAYFTADHSIDIEEMKAQIGTTLTHYMVPTAYLQMTQFPLTPNGKTDVKHLPEPKLAKVGGDYVSPKNKVEEDFCQIFASILTLDKVSAADSFFELGGTSLTATRVMIEAKNLGYDVAYSDVFSHPTAQALAKLQSNEEASEGEDLEVTNYDYAKIDALLAQNTLDSFRKGACTPLGDVLLTGANGYLGIHILHHLLENHLQQHPQYKVYCLVRHGRNGVTSEDRLKNLLFYYFEKNYKEMLGNQIIVVDGDVTNPQAFNEVAERTASSKLTVINCAAVVKHFSEGSEIEDINIGGLQNCVDFCLKTGARLIQTSTNSTGGESVNGYPDPQTHYSEQVHYFGQHLRSKYTHSKFLAERIVLEAIIEKGLEAKVVRLGNLAPRAVDGEFQINFRSNSAMGRLHIFQMLGACSYNTSVSQMEFSPIDEVADAILRLATTPKECCVFHPFNDHMVKLGDVVREMARTLMVDIAEVEEEDFQARLNEAARDPKKAQILQSMLAYKANSKETVSYFAKHNPYTIQVLARLGFHWNVTSWDYVHRFVSAIAALDFFEDER